MRPIPCKLVATLTAASVLLCGIVCACGGSLSVHADAAPGGHRGYVSACCDHSHGDEARHEDGHKPGPHGGGGHSCPHCQSAITAVPESGKAVADLLRLTASAGTLLPAAFAPPTVPVAPVRPLAHHGVSPPPAPTLLSLHCALTT